MIPIQSGATIQRPDPESKLGELGLNPEIAEAEQSDKNQFLELMIAQLENQNPLDPQEGGEFLAQLAQFSMVDGIERLNANNEQLHTTFRGSQALQAASLVGRSVMVESDRLAFAGEPLDAVVDLPQSSGAVRVVVSNSQGEVVKELALGDQSAGIVPFTWDGTNAAGELADVGSYSIAAYAKTLDGEEQVQTQQDMNIDSVTLGADGEVELNVQGFGPLSLEAVRQIR